MNIYQKIIIFLISLVVLILVYVSLILKTQQESITAFTGWLQYNYFPPYEEDSNEK